MQSVTSSNRGQVVGKECDHGPDWQRTVADDRQRAGKQAQERAATATGQVIFDGVVLVDGAANHPTRSAPFIRVDTEK